MKEVSSLLDFYLLIPCYNNREGLIRSLKSVHYHPEKFAVLIVDDGSSVKIDHSEILREVPINWSVNIIRLPVNQGITKALNAGMQWLAGNKGFNYVARLDCGDICSENRFYEQVEYLNKRPETNLTGSWCVFKDFNTGNSYHYAPPEFHKSIALQMYFRNTFIPSTVMWRATGKIKTSLFSEKFPHAEDYAFFYEILNNSEGAIIQQKLVTCEIDYKSISFEHRQEQLKSRTRVVRHYGKNKFLAAAGITWVRLLMAIPYPLMIKVKRLLHGK